MQAAEQVENTVDFAAPILNFVAVIVGAIIALSAATLQQRRNEENKKRELDVETLAEVADTLADTMKKFRSYNNAKLFSNEFPNDRTARTKAIEEWNELYSAYSDLNVRCRVAAMRIRDIKYRKDINHVLLWSVNVFPSNNCRFTTPEQYAEYFYHHNMSAAYILKHAGKRCRSEFTEWNYEPHYIPDPNYLKSPDDVIASTQPLPTDQLPPPSTDNTSPEDTH